MTTKSVQFRRLLWIFVGVLCALMALEVDQLVAQRTKDRTVRTPIEQQQPMNSLRALSQAFVQISKDVTPSVVTISTEKTVKMRGIQMWDPFADFFGQGNPHQGMSDRSFQQMGLGSGVVVSADGYILTNNHVVAEADTITVNLFDGRSLPAKVVGTDPKTDVAVIKVNARDLTPVRKGNSDELQVGEIVMAIGSPLNPSLAHTVTQGIVSAVGRSNVGLADYEDFIQTDAAINPGNSGGALVNLDGELIGINTAIATQSGGSQGIGFAVPVNMAMDVMDALIKNGKVIRGYLGVSIQDINDKMARAMGMRNTKGVVVGSVSPRSPADRAGIEAGDVITAVNGRTVESMNQFRTTIAQTAPGTNVALTVLRGNGERDYQIRLGEMPDSQQASTQGNGEDEEGGDNQGSVSPTNSRLGFDVANITREVARRYQIGSRVEGVVVTDVDQDSPALADNPGSAALRVGDVIRQVNRRPVTSVKEFDDAVQGLRRGDSVLLLVSRGDQGFLIAFDLP